MDAGKRQISFYFNGQDYLEIPFFQRSYVWKEDLLKKILGKYGAYFSDRQRLFYGFNYFKAEATK